MDSANSLWNNRRVLVTGCTGFLGGAVTRELLLCGARVVGLVRDHTRATEFVREIASGQVKVIHGRVEDTARIYSMMAVHEVAAVFDLAGSEEGLASVTRTAGLYPSLVTVVTARPAAPLRIARSDSTALVPLGMARFGEIFGPRDRRLSRVVPQTALALLAGKCPPFWSEAPRDYVFVRDAARACLRLAEAVHYSAHSHDCTFRSGWEFTHPAIADTISNALAGRGQEYTSAEPANPLGWRPEVPLNVAFSETTEWYRNLVRDDRGQEETTIRKAA